MGLINSLFLNRSRGNCLSLIYPIGLLKEVHEESFSDYD